MISDPAQTSRIPKVQNAALKAKQFFYSQCLPLSKRVAIWCGREVANFGHFVILRTRRRATKYRRLWRATATVYRLYVYATIVLLLSSALFTSQHGAEWTSAVLFTGVGMYGWAFVLWLKPYLDIFRSSGPARLMLKVIHAFVLVLAVVLARFFVANALKLPPQYFEVTVSLIALAAYIPLYIALGAFCAICVYALMLICVGCGWISDHALQSFIAPIFGRRAWLKRLSSRLRMSSRKALFHGIGAATVAIVAAGLLTGFFKISRYGDEGIRRFAYYADFQPAGLYPGVPCDARIRLQDNGIIAVARLRQDSVEIKTEFYKQLESPGRGCLTPK